MSERILTVSESLWLDAPILHPDYDDGLFIIRDSVGGETIIDKDEIPALIEALQQLRDEG